MKRLASLASAVPFSCLLLLTMPPGLQAQTAPSTGSIHGVLRDPSGAVIVTGRIEARHRDDRRSQVSTTDEAGRYVFVALPAGLYTVSASASGFATARRDDVVVLPDGDHVLDFALTVAPAVAFVEVSAAVGARPLAVETNPRVPRQPMPAHDGADYLKTIPGFSVMRKGGTDGDPMLRGMAGSRLGILLDGENIYGGCGNRMDPPTAYAFPEAYDRITVLKGPQTVLHGPGNSAGVVLFERDDDVERGVQFHASPTVGRFGRNDQVVDVKVGGARLYASGAATRSSMGDYRDGQGRAVHSRYERWSTNATAGWKPDEGTRLEISGAYSDGEAAYADRMMDGVLFARKNLGGRFERRRQSGVLSRIEAQAFYNYVDHVMDNFNLRTFIASPMTANPSVSNPDRKTVGARLATDLQWASKTTATVGGDWQANRHTVRSASNEPVSSYRGQRRVQDATFANLGFFGELTQGIGQRHRAIGGLRLDRWTGQDDRARVSIGMSGQMTNPTAGARRHETLVSGFGRYEAEAGAGATLYAGVGHAERFPDYWELISKESMGAISAFGTRPEQTTQLDAGVLYRQGAVSGSLSAFAGHVDDFILIQSNYLKAGTGMSMGGPTARAATVTRNVDASTWGGEATLAWSPMSTVKLDTSLAFVRGRNETDDRPLAQLPPLEGRLGLQYVNDTWATGVLARLVAAQTRYALNQGNIVGQDLGPTAAFGVLSVNAGRRLARLARVSAGVDNILDATYAEFVNRNGADVPGFTTTTRVNEPGRTVWLKLEFGR